ncbi:hypothetical protein FB45DRAFT_378857 [Roridomyces roridus]|uniref:Uncharacterized protein n=1 Tax=Roridomyces roridus TaxID=1738132 RepID=A0AAD7F8G5_9AGAR|nr:hypothetical protein FB45DRAFT_378857 [Roridomyces roridus]
MPTTIRSLSRGTTRHATRWDQVTVELWVAVTTACAYSGYQSYSLHSALPLGPCQPRHANCERKLFHHPPFFVLQMSAKSFSSSSNLRHPGQSPVYRMSAIFRAHRGKRLSVSRVLSNIQVPIPTRLSSIHSRPTVTRPARECRAHSHAALCWRQFWPLSSHGGYQARSRCTRASSRRTPPAAPHDGSLRRMNSHSAAFSSFHLRHPARSSMYRLSAIFRGQHATFSRTRLLESPASRLLQSSGSRTNARSAQSFVCSRLRHSPQHSHV